MPVAQEDVHGGAAGRRMAAVSGGEPAESGCDCIPRTDGKVRHPDLTLRGLLGEVARQRALTKQPQCRFAEPPPQQILGTVPRHDEVRLPCFRVRQQIAVGTTPCVVRLGKTATRREECCGLVDLACSGSTSAALKRETVIKGPPRAEKDMVVAGR